MVIYKNSRYSGSKVTLLKFSDGSIKPFIHDRPKFKATAPVDKAVVVADASTELDLLAFKFLPNQELDWWKLADHNNILFPFNDPDLNGFHDLFVGKVIKIPNV